MCCKVIIHQSLACNLVQLGTPIILISSIFPRRFLKISISCACSYFQCQSTLSNVHVNLYMKECYGSVFLIAISLKTNVFFSCLLEIVWIYRITPRPQIKMRIESQIITQSFSRYKQRSGRVSYISDFLKDNKLFKYSTFHLHV